MSLIDPDRSRSSLRCFAILAAAVALLASERGNLATIEGELDAGSGEIRGTWQARELAGGRPTAGDWTARRLTLEP